LVVFKRNIIGYAKVSPSNSVFSGKVWDIFQDTFIFWKKEMIEIMMCVHFAEALNLKINKNVMWLVSSVRRNHSLHQ